MMKKTQVKISQRLPYLSKSKIHAKKVALARSAKQHNSGESNLCLLKLVL